jgi:hypothetical protein
MKHLKIAAQVWILAVLAECVSYAVLLDWEIGLVILPFACVGGLPALLLFWFYLAFILPLFQSPKSKAITLFLAALCAANLALTLFVTLFGCWHDALLIYSVLNGATLFALLISFKKIAKMLFATPTPLVDYDTHPQPYQFKNHDPKN